MTGNLWKALDLMRHRKMLKGQRGDQEGNHCALGFLDEVNGTEPRLYREDPDVVALSAAIMANFPERVGEYTNNDWLIANFNNHPATTQDELELMFEKAAIQRDEILS